MKSKACKKCGEVKPLDAFYAGRARCRACMNAENAAYMQTEAGKAAGKAAQKRYRQSDKGKAFAIRRRQTEAYKAGQKRYEKSEKGKAVQKRMRAKYPEKTRARGAVNDALRYGKLIRQPCQVCGNEKSEAHHDSYEKHRWLDVVWLCRKHHDERHRSLEVA